MDDIQADEAVVNVTYDGTNGDLPHPVPFDATDGDIRQWTTEAIQGGDVPGIGAHANVDFTDFVVDRFSATEETPWNKIFLRPKTPFGGE